MPAHPVVLEKASQNEIVVVKVILSHLSTLTGNTDIAILSIRLSVRLSVRDVPVSDENGCPSFFHRMVAQSF